MIKKIFYSYSHKDKAYLEKLQTHIKPIIKEYKIKEFVDEHIRGGEVLDEKIMTNIQESDLVISLISPDYLASEYCQKEMKIAIDAHKSFPIIARTCDWKNTSLRDIKVMPQDGKPIIDYDNDDKAYQYIAQELRKKIQDSLQIIICNEGFSKYLEKIDFLHPNKAKITLADTFVYPNICSSKDEQITIKEILENEKYKEILFFSPFYSGKTTLLKYMYSLLLQQDIYPLYIQGKRIVKTKYFEEEIRKCFEEQYNGDFDTWKNSQITYILIDDYHHSINDNFIDFLRNNYNNNNNIKIIVTIEQEEYFSFFKDFPQFSTFDRFELRPFGREQQEEIIKKWLLLKDNNVPIDFYNKVDITEKRINEIVSSQIILPRYPTNILLILQAIDSKNNDMQITSYGYCYFALILNYLTKNGITQESGIDSSINFLSELSYNIFNCKETYTQQHYKNFKKEYKDKFVIQDSILNRLESGDYPILHIDKDSGCVKFEQDFIYYYFLGKILSEKISKEDIELFCENIHQKIYMYIIVFIIHHSKNIELIEDIILRCMLVLDKTQEASYLFDETHNFITKLDIPKMIMNAKSVEENRAMERKMQDNHTDIEDTDNEISDNEVYKGMKLSEVLSQILKNRSGSFEKSRIKEILDALISIRLRINKMIFELCEDKDFEKFITQSLKEFFKHKNQKISDEKAQKFVKRLVNIASIGSSLGIVNDTSFLIYTDNIIEDLENLIETDKKPSREIILFLTSIKEGLREKHFKQLEKMIQEYKNKKYFFAVQILSYSLQHYLNTHSTDNRLELKICKLLELPTVNRAADILLLQHKK